MESTSARTDTCASAQKAHPRPEGQDRYTISEVVAFSGLSGGKHWVHMEITRCAGTSGSG